MSITVAIKATRTLILIILIEILPLIGGIVEMTSASSSILCSLATIVKLSIRIASICYMPKLHRNDII